MPYVPTRNLTFKELTVLVPSGTSIPDEEALDVYILLGVGCRDHERQWLVSASLEVSLPGSFPQDTISETTSTWGKITTKCERRARGTSLGLIRANRASARFVTLA